ncbi:MAG: hypothetical protein F4Y00_06865 [Bacteroidetes bacterium SB0662_bin_6]|nr:hypothetical protein [Bacteroidetes bacterium SB0668_bin_1]MYE04673.1 hypothetical protein [Bacteroidetes bacterium SB0662_bin_6]
MNRILLLLVFLAPLQSRAQNLYGSFLMSRHQEWYIPGERIVLKGFGLMGEKRSDDRTYLAELNYGGYIKDGGLASVTEILGGVRSYRPLSGRYNGFASAMVGAAYVLYDLPPAPGRYAAPVLHGDAGVEFAFSRNMQFSLFYNRYFGVGGDNVPALSYFGLKFSLTVHKPNEE